MELLLAIGVETLRTLYLAAPFLLLGLVVAGFLHVLLPTATIQRFLGRPGMGGVTCSAVALCTAARRSPSRCDAKGRASRRPCRF